MKAYLLLGIMVSILTGATSHAAWTYIANCEVHFGKHISFRQIAFSSDEAKTQGEMDNLCEKLAVPAVAKALKISPQQKHEVEGTERAVLRTSEVENLKNYLNDPKKATILTPNSVQN